MVVVWAWVCGEQAWCAPLRLVCAVVVVVVVVVKGVCVCVCWCLMSGC